eukprot:Rmarinus@m.4677
MSDAEGSTDVGRLKNFWEKDAIKLVDQKRQKTRRESLQALKASSTVKKWQVQSTGEVVPEQPSVRKSVVDMGDAVVVDGVLVERGLVRNRVTSHDTTIRNTTQSTLSPTLKGVTWRRASNPSLASKTSSDSAIGAGAQEGRRTKRYSLQSPERYRHSSPSAPVSVDASPWFSDCPVSSEDPVRDTVRLVGGEDTQSYPHRPGNNGLLATPLSALPEDDDSLLGAGVPEKAREGSGGNDHPTPLLPLPPEGADAPVSDCGSSASASDLNELTDIGGKVDYVSTPLSPQPVEEEDRRLLSATAVIEPETAQIAMVPRVSIPRLRLPDQAGGVLPAGPPPLPGRPQPWDDGSLEARDGSIDVPVIDTRDSDRSTPTLPDEGEEHCHDDASNDLASSDSVSAATEEVSCGVQQYVGHSLSDTGTLDPPFMDGLGGAPGQTGCQESALDTTLDISNPLTSASVQGESLEEQPHVSASMEGAVQSTEKDIGFTLDPAERAPPLDEGISSPLAPVSIVSTPLPDATYTLKTIEDEPQAASCGVDPSTAAFLQVAHGPSGFSHAEAVGDGTYPGVRDEVSCNVPPKDFPGEFAEDVGSRIHIESCVTEGQPQQSLSLVDGGYTPTEDEEQETAALAESLDDLKLLVMQAKDNDERLGIATDRKEDILSLVASWAECNVVEFLQTSPLRRTHRLRAEILHTTLSLLCRLTLMQDVKTMFGGSDVLSDLTGLALKLTSALSASSLPALTQFHPFPSAPAADLTHAHQRDSDAHTHAHSEGTHSSAASGNANHLIESGCTQIHSAQGSFSALPSQNMHRCSLLDAALDFSGEDVCIVRELLQRSGSLCVRAVTNLVALEANARQAALSEAPSKFLGMQAGVVQSLISIFYEGVHLADDRLVAQACRAVFNLTVDPLAVRKLLESGWLSCTIALEENAIQTDEDGDLQLTEHAVPAAEMGLRILCNVLLAAPATWLPFLAGSLDDQCLGVRIAELLLSTLVFYDVSPGLGGQALRAMAMLAAETQTRRMLTTACAAAALTQLLDSGVLKAEDVRLSNDLHQIFVSDEDDDEYDNEGGEETGSLRAADAVGTGEINDNNMNATSGADDDTWQAVDRLAVARIPPKLKSKNSSSTASLVDGSQLRKTSLHDPKELQVARDDLFDFLRLPTHIGLSAIVGYSGESPDDLLLRDALLCHVAKAWGFVNLSFDGSSRRLVLCAKKKKSSRTVNYHIALDPASVKRGSASYVGKLRANRWKSEFYLYDAGWNPRRHKDARARSSSADVRRVPSDGSVHSNHRGITDNNNDDDCDDDHDNEDDDSVRNLLAVVQVKSKYDWRVLLPPFRDDGTPMAFPDSTGENCLKKLYKERRKREGPGKAARESADGSALFVMQCQKATGPLLPFGTYGVSQAVRRTWALSVVSQPTSFEGSRKAVVWEASEHDDPELSWSLRYAAPLSTLQAFGLFLIARELR